VFRVQGVRGQENARVKSEERRVKLKPGRQGSGKCKGEE
jgi:hypothetical protein